MCNKPNYGCLFGLFGGARQALVGDYRRTDTGIIAPSKGIPFVHLSEQPVGYPPAKAGIARFPYSFRRNGKTNLPSIHPSWTYCNSDSPEPGCSQLPALCSRQLEFLMQRTGCLVVTTYDYDLIHSSVNGNKLNHRTNIFVKNIPSILGDIHCEEGY
jgi:hypothetical protein